MAERGRRYRVAAGGAWPPRGWPPVARDRRWRVAAGIAWPRVSRGRGCHVAAGIAWPQGPMPVAKHRAARQAATADEGVCGGGTASAAVDAHGSTGGSPGPSVSLLARPGLDCAGATVFRECCERVQNVA